MKPMTGMLCVVYWTDAASHDSWSDTEQLKENSGLVECASTGFFLEETSSEVKLVRSCHLDGGVSEGMFAIPKGMVKEIRFIKNVRPRTKKLSGETPTVRD